MPKKFDRCVKKVKKQSPNVNPYAVCKASMKKKKAKTKNQTKKKMHKGSKPINTLSISIGSK